MNTPVEPLKTPTRVNQVAFDPEYTPGARNAVNVCLRIQTSEKVCVITDEETIEIAAAVVHELEILGAPYHAWVLEDLAQRPLRDLPKPVLDDMETSQVSIFAVQAQTNELRSRIQMTDVVNRRDAPCPHGEHQSRNHAGRHAGGLSARRPAEPESSRDGAQGL